MWGGLTIFKMPTQIGADIESRLASTMLIISHDGNNAIAAVELPNQRYRISPLE